MTSDFVVKSIYDTNKGLKEIHVISLFLHTRNVHSINGRHLNIRQDNSFIFHGEIIRS